MGDRIPSGPFADAWIHVDRTEDPTFFFDLLDATRAHLLERARKDPAEFFAPLEVSANSRVLDAGCGTGNMLRAAAPLLTQGSGVGIDLSELMIAEARRRAADAFPQLTFEVGDVLALPFDVSSFDRVMVNQVLVHLPDPQPALSEIHRVLSPGGIVNSTDIDWDSVVVNCSDKELGRRFSRSACDELRNGTIARETGWRMREAGFENVRFVTRVDIAREVDGFHRWFVEPSMRHFVRIGAFSQEEADAFMRDLDERIRNGRYFSARTVYTTIATRP